MGFLRIWTETRKLHYQEELALAEWFEREEIPVTERNISLTNEMILAFKNSII